MKIPEQKLDPNYYHNHGDNPAMKKFLQICMENAKGKSYIDHRTYFIDRGQRFLHARNWDDFLQRDVKAITFPRAMFCLAMNTFASYTALVWARHIIPIGRFGIRNVRQTAFYQNFGYLGVLGVAGMAFAAIYTEIKTVKFTAHKFYRHVIMQDRNWLMEGQRVSRFGDYYFADNFLSNENNLFKSKQYKIMVSKQLKEPTHTGPYHTPTE